MTSHYQTLSLKSSASSDEIRRAYRILARRYHPDLNPGKENGERFRKIAEAYEVLSDATRRAAYDTQLEIEQRDDLGRGFDAYTRAQAKNSKQRSERRKQRQTSTGQSHDSSGGHTANLSAKRPDRGVSEQLRDLLRGAMGIAQKVTNSGPEQATKSTEAAPLRSVSVIEVSLSLKEAVFGVKKAIEIPDPTGPRKLSVTIPPGVRSGSVVRLRSKSNPGEDLVLIVRLATHPFLSIQARGLVAEIPVSVLEAHAGASISVPTLDEPVSVKIPAGSQSGSEIRLRNRGIPLKNGDRGDLFIRLLIKIPDSVGAVGLKEHFAALDQYYSSAVRNGLPKTLLD